MKSASGRNPLPPPGTTILRVTTAWGTTILAVRELLPGQSVSFDDGRDGSIAVPQGLHVAPIPVRAVQSGWQIDPRGATQGLIVLGGREQDPTQLVPPLVIAPGDWGLLQYGLISLFFQFGEVVAPMPAGRGSFDRPTAWSIAAAAIWHLAALTFLALTAAPTTARPLELSSERQIAARFGLNAWIDAQQEETPVTPRPEPGPDRFVDFRTLSLPIRQALGEIRSLAPSASGPTIAPASPVTIGVVPPSSLSLMPAGNTAKGGLGKDVVDRVVGADLGGLQASCNREIPHSTDFGGSVELSLNVGADGSIRTAEVSATPRRPKVEDCVLSHAQRTWRFPVSFAPSSVKVVFRLGPP